MTIRGRISNLNETFVVMSHVFYRDTYEDGTDMPVLKEEWAPVFVTQDEDLAHLYREKHGRPESEYDKTKPCGPFLAIHRAKFQQYF